MDVATTSIPTDDPIETHHASNFEVLKIAAAAPADPRTVRRVLRGLGSEMSRERVTRAARRVRLAHLLPADD